MGRGILYCSTRGSKRDVTFEEVVLEGLAPDKGLYVPQELPRITPEQLEKVGGPPSSCFVGTRGSHPWRACSPPQLRDATFAELAHSIMRLFIGPDDIPSENLKVLIERSTASFRAQGEPNRALTIG
jgi:threonine synthase